jgi:hypothetical protein
MTDLPTQSDFEDFAAWTGRDVLAPDGDRLGAVDQIFLDEATDIPEWVLVRLDDADKKAFVPLAGASVEEHAIRLDHDRERIAAAPQLEVEDTLTVTECRRLYDHYGLAYSQEESPTVLPEGAAADSAAETSEGERTRLRRYESTTQPDATKADAESGDSTTGDADETTAHAGADMPATKGTGSVEPTPVPIAPPAPRPIPPEGGFQAQQGDARQPGGKLAVLKRRPALPITLAGGIAALIGFLVLRKRR